jgi:uncharacterized protein
MTDAPRLDAGGFSTWLVDVQAALAGERGSDVPCGDCTACCTASQFIHIGPDETDTLAHIPTALLFAAPRMPRGHVLMGYDQRGHCPMLIDAECSIYDHRPNTCRTYDCRVFPAAGLEADDDKPLIARQARRWEFRHPAPVDEVAHDAVRRAAAYVAAHSEVLSDVTVPVNATQLAVLAIDIHEVFLRRDPEQGEVESVDPDAHEVRVAVRRRSERRPAGS